MSWANKEETAEEYIEKNRPENGVFRVYWDDNVTYYPDITSNIIVDPKKSNRLRWEWYYKDGKRADGISRGWWQNGKIKQVQTWKDGKLNGKTAEWWSNGKLHTERYYKDGELVGRIINYNEKGEIISFKELRGKVNMSYISINETRKTLEN